MNVRSKRAAARWCLLSVSKVRVVQAAKQQQFHRLANGSSGGRQQRKLAHRLVTHRWRKINKIFDFRLNREMREKIGVYDLIANKFWLKLMSNCRIELCRNFKFCLRMNPKFEFLLKPKSNSRNSCLLFHPNLVSRPQNSNPAPSIWSECSSWNFS